MRRAVLTPLTIALSGALLSGCWAVPGQSSNRHAYNPAEDAIGVDTIGSLHEIWSTPLDSGPAGDPVVSQQRVHAHGARSAFGLDPATGDKRWTYTPPTPIRALQPFVRADRVLVSRWDDTATASPSTEDADVTVSLDAAAGNNERLALEGQTVSTRGQLALSWDVVYFQIRVGPPSWSARLAVRDVDSGERLCCDPLYASYSASPPPGAPVPLTLGTTQIFAAGHGTNDPGAGSFGNGVRGFPIEDGHACPGAAALYHCPEWAVPLNGTTSTPPVVSDDQNTVWVGTDAGTIYAVDTENATVRWSTPVGSAVSDAPALANGSLYVPTDSGALVVLNADTGAQRWSGATGAAIRQQPAVAGGLVFTGSNDGTVSAFGASGCGAATCTHLWNRTTGSAITGAPAVSNGQLYVGTADGRLVAYGI
jgi:outer membrane protein assembly factor BamB